MANHMVNFLDEPKKLNMANPMAKSSTKIDFFVKLLLKKLIFLGRKLPKCAQGKTIHSPFQRFARWTEFSDTFVFAFSQFLRLKIKLVEPKKIF